MLFSLLSLGGKSLYGFTYIYIENDRDRRICRMDEYSDSEDEGDDDRKNEKSYRETKRPRLIEETTKNGGSRSSATNRGQGLSSPLPPEPSPITPLAQDDNGNAEIKSKPVLASCVLCCLDRVGLHNDQKNNT